MRDSSDRNLFDSALLACKELRRHINGEETIKDQGEIASKRALIKMASSESFYFFAKAVLGFDKLTGKTHCRWANDLQDKLKTRSYLMRMKPRGTYKTTLYGEALPLWLWATVSPHLRIMYTSANQALLDEVSAHLDRFIDYKSDSLYAFVFGITRDRRAKKNTNDVFNIVGRDNQAKGFSLILRPVGGSTNGIHPHIIIGDDLADSEDRSSPAVRAQKKQWWDSLNPLLVPFERAGQRPIKIVMLIGTRWHLDDVYQHVMSKNADVTNPDDRFDIEIEGVYAADGKLNYPEFFTEERINELKGKISTVFFSCQYLNQPLPEGSRIFEENRLHFVRPDQYDIRQGANLCFFDPSQGKSGGDFPAVWWVNVQGTTKTFYRAIDQKIELSGVIGLIAQYNKEDLVKELLFENNGTMDLLEERVLEAHRAIGHPIQITKIHETRNKVERITAMQPDLYNGSARFRSDWRDAYPEAMNQIIFFPAWGHDDCPDVCEKALTYISRNSPGEFVSSTKSSGGSLGRGALAGSLKKSSNSRSISW